ncbi:hypothetical protein A1359_20010 [Methylomonas lenta]|uniref:PEP-CTERM sorting domain-containing protein n=1 Tax=Methylomonas lenta TaxID=980561 RepID=A0A177NSD7_9GAMM|nr:VPLPA-CTERM sorting domain-containing protein [Methylomonas lenta]OAI20946.1 hypothetical protein A1359_20010 [Methylomonas lenta]
MIKKMILAAAFLAVNSGQIHAATLNADGAWNVFDVDEFSASSGGLEWIDIDGGALSFDFTLTESAYLKVVDGGFSGDQFQVFDNGQLLGETSTASNNYPTSLGLDFDQAFSNADYSQGVYLLGVGSHTITGLLSISAIDDIGDDINATVGAVSLTAVPLPAAAWLYAIGLAFFGAVSRRRIINA